MNKKKIIWGIVIFIFFAIIVWIDIPYIFPTNNLISKKIMITPINKYMHMTIPIDKKMK